jgi:hypothetical protein
MRKLLSEIPPFLSAICAGISLSQIGTIVSIVAGLVAIVAGAPAAWRTIQKVIAWFRPGRSNGPHPII